MNRIALAALSRPREGVIRRRQKDELRQKLASLYIVHAIHGPLLPNKDGDTI